MKRTKYLSLFISITFILLLIIVTSPTFAETGNTASISGVVTGADGTTLPDITVRLKNSDWDTVSETTTDADGQYAFSGLSSGSYRIYFNPSNYNRNHNTTYTYQYYADSPCSGSPELITIGAGQSVSNIGAQLHNGGSISGKVYNQNNQPLNGVKVYANDPNGTYSGVNTNSSGEYYFNCKPTVNFNIQFNPAAYNAQYGTDYLEQWYNNQADINIADEVAVVEGQTAIANAYLQVSTGTVSGIKAEACGNQIALSWSAFSGAQSYNIYRTYYYRGAYEKIGNTTSVSYTDAELPLSTTYWYKVAPVTATGEGSFSAPVSTMTDENNTEISPDDSTSSGIVSTVAGIETSGYSGDGDAATLAQLYAPEGVAFDSNGNMYIADNNNIRKVDSYGIISTVAMGSGYNIAIDSNDNIYTNNQYGTIKIDTSGNISEVARLSGSMTFDNSGNLYVAGYSRVSKVDSSGNISTIAGANQGYSGDGGPASSAQLNNGNAGIAFDNNGNLYIADTYNNCIRMVDTDGIISTVAGTGVGGYSGDGGPATDAKLYNPTDVAFDQNGNMYIVDNNNCRIRKVDTSGEISTVAGNGWSGYQGDGETATTTYISYPKGIAFDSFGNMYISSNHCVRKIGLPGLQNSSITPRNGDFDKNSSAQADIIISLELNGNTLSKIANGRTILVQNTDYTVSGNIVTIKKEYLAKQEVGTTRLTFNFSSGEPQTLIISVTDSTSSGIISTVVGGGNTGYSGDGGPATSAQVYQPRGVAFDSSGNMYLADNRNNCIRKVDSSGIISTVAGTGVDGYSGDGGPAISAQLNEPLGVASDSNGNLYIADHRNNRIRKVDSSGIISTVAGTGVGGYSGDGGPAISAQIHLPSDVAVDNDGNLYVADTSNNCIRKVDSSGKISTIAGSGNAENLGDGGLASSASLYYPKGVAVDSFGNIYIADSFNHRIRKVDSSGIISTVAGGGNVFQEGDLATATQLWTPTGVAVDSRGNLYLSDWDNHRIRKVDTDGNITTVAGNGNSGYSGDGGFATSAQVSQPAGLAFDSSDNLYIAVSANNSIRKIVFSNDSSELVFADSNLEAAIREEIDKPEGPLTASDLENIYELCIFGRGITSLEGIQNLKNLKGLYAWDNPITDLSPLEQLPDLQWLDLEGTQISDFSPLSSLTNLENLCLAYDNLTSDFLNYLGGLINLRTLNLKGNLINNNNILSVMSTEGNTNSGLSALSNLSNLVDLDLSDNNITDVSALSSLTELSELNLSSNQISNITPISNLKEIQSIDLSENQINDISALGNLEKVESLDISSNQVENIEPLSSLDTVTTLNLSDNNIVSIEPLNNLSDLQTVYIGNNNITDFSPLQNLPNIEEYSSDNGSYCYNNWESKMDIIPSKEWTIRFSYPVASESINSQNIYVKDSSGTQVDVEVTPGADPCTVVVKAPVTQYTPGQTYTLYVSKKIKSIDGEELNEPVVMTFDIADATASLETQSILGNVFMVKDLVSFGIGLTNLLETNAYYVDYIKQLPEDHYIAREMDDIYCGWGMEDWRETAPPGINTIYNETISILYVFNNFFDKDSPISDDTSADKFYNELSTMVSNLAGTIYKMDIPWWGTDIFRPIKEVGNAVEFVANWNKIRDGEVVLGSNLKLSGDKAYNVGENSNLLKLTMVVKPKWELKYILGRPSEILPVAQSEQALWVSENPDVATVYKGKVTGHKPGEATIRVKFYNKSAKIEIEVN